MTTQQEVNTAAQPWFDYFEKLYTEKWSKVFRLLTRKANLTNLDKSLIHDTDLIWLLLYDLTGAITSKSLKSTELVDMFIQSIAETYDINKQALWQITSSIPGILLAHGVYLAIYHQLSDEPETRIIKDPEAIQGFTMFSNSIIQNSNLGYLFKHISDITDSAK